MSRLKPGEDGYGHQQVKESTNRAVKERQNRIESMRDECERAFGKGTVIYRESDTGKTVETKKLRTEVTK